MKIKEVTCTINRKVNLGNYENIDFNASIKIEVSEDSETLEAYKQGWEIVKGEIKYQLKELSYKEQAAEAMRRG